MVLSNVFLAGLPDFVTTGQTLAVLYNATAFSPRADFTFMLYGCQRSLAMPRDPKALVKTLASSNLTLPIGTGRNVGVFRWAVPTRIFASDGPTPDESLAYYVLWDSEGGSGSATSTSTSTSTSTASSRSVLVGLASKALTLINPGACAISSVSLYPSPSDPGGALRGVLDSSTQTSLGVTWTRVGDAGTTYSIELWQERFYYSGGDALLTNVSVVGGAVSTSAAGGGAGGPGASMTYTWGPIPTTLSSIEPVYMLVRVLSGPFLGSWGRSRVFRLRSAPLPGLGAFLATACRPRAGGGGGAGAPATTLLNPAIPPALCARNCSSCEAAGGLWSAGGLVNLTFSTNTTSSTVPLTSSEIQRIGTTWGAFSQVSSVCLPKASTSMSGGHASTTISVEPYPSLSGAHRRGQGGRSAATLECPAPQWIEPGHPCVLPHTHGDTRHGQGIRVLHHPLPSYWQFSQLSMTACPMGAKVKQHAFSLSHFFSLCTVSADEVHMHTPLTQLMTTCHF